MPGKHLLCGAITLIAAGCSPKPIASKTVASVVAQRTSGSRPEAKNPMSATDSAEAMRELRLRALNWSAKDLGITPSSEFPRVYGVLMEWPLRKATATVISFASGDASLYTSSGFGVIGGVAHDQVRVVARRFVSVAERYYDSATPTEAYSLPLEGKVRFVLLGYKGRRAIEGDIPSPPGQGTVYDLFAAGQNVLTELRQIAEASSR